MNKLFSKTIPPDIIDNYLCGIRYDSETNIRIIENVRHRIDCYGDLLMSLKIAVEQGSFIPSVKRILEETINKAEGR